MSKIRFKINLFTFIINSKKRKEAMNIVITGSTKGIGYALAREFLSNGARVVISSRTKEHVQEAVTELAKEFGENVEGAQADVSVFEDLQGLAQFAEDHFGEIDVWINNAGVPGESGTFLKDVTPGSLKTVVETNLLGTLYGCKAAIPCMASGGHIFNMDGYGANGMSTPGMAAYGATKRGIPQLTESLNKEKNGSMGFHTLSPGMVVTDLLTKNATDKSKRFFNILAEKPETVARFLVKKILQTPKGVKGRYIKFLTNSKVFWRFLTARARKNRFFTVS